MCSALYCLRHRPGRSWRLLRLLSLGPTHVGSAGLRPSPSPRHGGVRSTPSDSPSPSRSRSTVVRPEGGWGERAPSRPVHSGGSIRSSPRGYERRCGERRMNGPLKQGHNRLASENETDSTSGPTPRSRAKCRDRQWSRVNADMGAPPRKVGKGPPMTEYDMRRSIRQARTRRPGPTSRRTSTRLVPQV